MQGSLREFTVSDLLQLFQIAVKSGRLEVRGPGQPITIFFEEGTVSGIGAAQWSLVAELRRIEWLTPDILHQLELLAEADDDAGLSLMVRAMLTPAVWGHFVERQLEVLIYPLLDLREGTFEIHVDEEPSLVPLRIDQAPQQIILNAARWHEELARAAQDGLTPESVWRRAFVVGHGPSGHLLLSLLRRPRSVSDLAAAAGMSTLQIFDRLRRLRDAGLVEPAALIESTRASVS